MSSQCARPSTLPPPPSRTPGLPNSMLSRSHKSPELCISSPHSQEWKLKPPESRTPIGVESRIRRDQRLLNLSTYAHGPRQNQHSDSSQINRHLQGHKSLTCLETNKCSDSWDATEAPEARLADSQCARTIMIQVARASLLSEHFINSYSTQVPLRNCCPVQ